MSYKLSPSRMNLFFECKRCFWLRVNEKVERPSGPFPSLPSGIDKSVKKHFDRFREEGKKPPEIERCNEDLELFKDQEFLEKARSWRSEPKWRDDATGAVLRGGVDDLMRNEDGEIVVLDYKTRGYPPKGENSVPHYYSRQVNLYNLILRENGYSTADYGLILYFYPDGFQENGDFVFETEVRKTGVDIGKAKNLVREAVQTLNGEIPEHDEECEYSDWRPR
ncbi:MAG: PD-(D/E)XK nuclease family protein [Candidatus Halalkalibacterium sp. M3_1C_030]